MKQYESINVTRIVNVPETVNMLARKGYTVVMVLALPADQWEIICRPVTEVIAEQEADKPELTILDKEYVLEI